MVGCVLVRNGRIVGEGYHHRFGGPHAEVEALAAAGFAARGATAYVTLEPCSHYGKTPPCVIALIQAGVKRLVAAHRDPFPEVSGRGFAALSEAGIDVRIGLLSAEAAELNAPFLTRIVLNRPYVIAKWAQSLDGKIATRTGDSKWISGPAARQVAHRTRARVDAVAVGLGTVLADDPSLDARGVRRKRVASRVVFDSRLRVPPRATIVMTARQIPTVVFTTTRACHDKRKRTALEKQGVKVVACRTNRGRVSIADALGKLAGMGMTNVLLEGGGELIGSFMDAGLVDEIHVFTSPIIIGGRDGRSGCAGLGVAHVRDATAPRIIQRRRIGRDEFMVARLTFAPFGA
jgi:diaminohydroxyphosphoribosylaminopyrimidine deaminase/5-amino-6-(5-phosphoribosylamino)uracil reductase